MFGGEILTDPWGSRLGTPLELEHLRDYIADEFSRGKVKYSFNPDVVAINGEEVTYSEIKSLSTKSAIAHCSIPQISANFVKTLESSEARNWPFPGVEYAFFKYGGSRELSVGLYKYGTRGLVNKLIKSDKQLVIVPMNLLLFLSTFANKQRLNQHSCQYSSNVGEYYSIRGSTLTKLSRDECDFQKLVGDCPSIDLNPNLLSLDTLEFESFQTPKIKGRYHRDFVVPSFPVARYFIPNERQKEVAETLRENYEEITFKLGLRDLYKPIPF